MKKIKIILDTDPGNDDLMAIIMALKSELIDVRGLTVVGGNASIENTTNNALSLLTYLNRVEVPVYVGNSSALNEISTSTEEFDEFVAHRIEIHGESGLHVTLPSPSVQPRKQHAVDFIIEEVESNKGEIILVPVGPLTNIADAIKKQPKLKEWVQSIHVMGGAVGVPGNVTKHAEFNIYCDPEAANDVFASGIEIKLCGLNITRLTSVRKDELNWLHGTSRGEVLITELLKNTFEQNSRRKSFSLHDPVAVLSLLHPNLIEWERFNISVMSDGPEFGRTIGIADTEGTVAVGVRIDSSLAKKKIAEILAG